jgi:hypothetical protein
MRSWLHFGCVFALAELLGYLLAVELHDRYPQFFCFIFVLCVITALEQLSAYLKDRRVARSPIPPARRAIGSPPAVVRRPISLPRLPGS